MALAGVWGTVPQAEAVAQDATRAIQKIEASLTSDSSTEHTGTTLDKERGDEEVISLARRLTQHSVKQHDGSYKNPFVSSDDPALDPSSGKFSPEAWTRTLIGWDRLRSDC